MKLAYEFLREGGRWLGSLRERIQTMFRNGDSVIWGSQDKVSHTPTVRELEELGSYAVKGYHEEVVEPLLKLLKEVLKEDTNQESLKNRIYYAIHQKPRWLEILEKKS